MKEQVKEQIERIIREEFNNPSLVLDKTWWGTAAERICNLFSPQLEQWERPKVPSGQMEDIFELAECFRAIQKAPSVNIDHFLLAYILKTYPPAAKSVLEVFADVRDEWEKRIG